MKVSVFLILIGVSYAVASTKHCTTEDPLSHTGTCVNSAHKCESRGGKASGLCGLFDVCCLFESTCGESSSENPAYFQNENYSQGQIGSGACTFSYAYGSSVCQVRMTFVDFSLDGDVSGSCISDYFVVSGGNIGHFDPICGDQAGREVTVNVVPEGGPLEVYVYQSSGLETAWNIEMQTIACAEEEEEEEKQAEGKNLIDEAIIAALEALKEGMITGYPELGIPPLDPLQIASIPLNIDTNDTRLHGSLTNITMKNLSTFEIVSVTSNLLLFWAKIDLNIGVLDTKGLYTMEGTVANLFPIYGDGPFTLDASDLSLYGYIDLGMLEEGYLGVTKIDLDINANKTVVEFEGIEGGGDMSDFINGVLSSLGPDILDTIADEALPHLEEALKNEINNILHKNPNVTTEEPSQKDESVNDFFDIVFANLRQAIIAARLDPLPLIEDNDTFTVELFNSTLEGDVFVGDGSINGLSTIHRDGNMTLEYVGEQDEAIIGGVVGLIDLEAEYSIHLKLGLINNNLGVSFKMSHLSIEILTDVFLHQSNITLEKCQITDFGPGHFHIKGSGPVDSPFYNLVVNGLLGVLQTTVTSQLQNVICHYLELAITGSAQELVMALM